MHVPKLEPDEILAGPDGQSCKERDALQVANFQHDTPLWYYVLKEAQMRHGGRCLGPVGSRIVADVFVGLLQGDGESYVNNGIPGWTPTLPAGTPGTFTLADLFRFLPAEAVNPNGGDSDAVHRHQGR